MLAGVILNHFRDGCCRVAPHLAYRVRTYARLSWEQTTFQNPNKGSSSYRSSPRISLKQATARLTIYRISLAWPSCHQTDGNVLRLREQPANYYSSYHFNNLDWRKEDKVPLSLSLAKLPRTSHHLVTEAADDHHLHSRWVNWPPSWQMTRNPLKKRIVVPGNALRTMILWTYFSSPANCRWPAALLFSFRQGPACAKSPFQLHKLD